MVPSLPKAVVPPVPLPHYSLYVLAGAAGPIPALCVLPSWTDAGTSSSISTSEGGSVGIGASKGVSPGFYDLGMMAMSSWKNTFIVGIYPEVRKKCLPPRNPMLHIADILAFLFENSTLLVPRT